LFSYEKHYIKEKNKNQYLFKMGCCNKTTDKKLKQSFSSMEDFKISHELPKEAVFSGKWGKLLYFIILVFFALTPIINIAGIYVFYVAVYGKPMNKKTLNAKKHKDSDEA
jgi:hypothetical protein